jgi:hypothetical protein
MTTTGPRCRFCDVPLQKVFVDLGMTPLSNSYLKPTQLNQMEPFYPLRCFVCASCFLVQLEEFETPDQIFTDYAYLSSYSDTWLQHAKSYCEMMIPRFGLSEHSQVIEIASNDGYLLTNFVERGIRALGIEPAANIAAIAVQKGIPTLARFFNEQTSKELVSDGIRADLLVGNNVLAHVPDLNGFIKAMKLVLKAQGVITMEFPHLMRLMEESQFDTIYHEHFSYFSLSTVERVFAHHGLRLFDVEELPTHGGSLRIFACHAEDASKNQSVRVEALRNREKLAGLTHMETYLSFAEKTKETKRKLLEFLIGVKREGKTIAGYGAPAKGNTLLNYCGIGSDFLEYTVDRSPEKQGNFLPGTHIPIHHPDRLKETRPDFVLVLPWNLINEIKDQMSHIRHWGGRFVVPIPEVKIHS